MDKNRIHYHVERKISSDSRLSPDRGSLTLDVLSKCTFAHLFTAGCPGVVDRRQHFVVHFSCSMARYLSKVVGQ